MGLFDLTCPASHVGIRPLEDVVLVIVAEEDGRFLPAAPPISGRYDGYGKIENIPWGNVVGAAPAARTLRGFVALRERGELELPWADDPEAPFGADVSEENLRHLLEHVKQGAIFERVRSDEQPSQMVRALGRKLDYVIVHATFYEAVHTLMSKLDLGGELDELGFDALRAAACPVNALALELVDERVDWTGYVLNELALFRAWFEPRASWRQGPSGQFSRRELAAMTAKAKQELAAWPALVAALEP